jgi:hypothetical protein
LLVAQRKEPRALAACEAAVALDVGGDAFEILFPCWFVHRDPALSARANSALRKGPLEGVNLYGASFWLTKRA